MQKNIPVLFVQERTLAETYEKALLTLYTQGARLKTQYDKPGAPLSIDATMNLTIQEPLTDPMIHNEAGARVTQKIKDYDESHK
jgi:thymidylate synthase